MPNGILAVAYISRYFVAGMFAQKFPELMTSEVLSELLKQGIVAASNADRFFRVGYSATPVEIESLVEQQGFQVVSHSATDGFRRYISNGVNNFTSSQY